MVHRGKSSAGSFNDEFERLLERLAGSALGEVGKPVSSEKNGPTRKRQPRIGRCAALHNRFLLDAHSWPDKSR